MEVHRGEKGADKQAEWERDIKGVMGRESIRKTKFKLKPGQIDYTNARWAPVINCVVTYGGSVLVVQRSNELHFYPGYWNGISGFLDDQRSLRQKVMDELSEELGITENEIKRITVGDIFDQEAPEYRKTWVVHPVLVEIATNKITLDWEARNYRWVTLDEAKNLTLLPGFDEVLKRISRLELLS